MMYYLIRKVKDMGFGDFNKKDLIVVIFVKKNDKGWYLFFYCKCNGVIFFCVLYCCF